MSSSHWDGSNTSEVRARDPEGRVYRVRAVKRGMWLRGDFDSVGVGASVADWLFSLVFDLVLKVLLKFRADAEQEWKVGVLRRGRVVERVLYKESLPRGTAPGERMAEIVATIEGGRISTLG